jgi:DNA-binding CsgD family transcriptional regulator
MKNQKRNIEILALYHKGLTYQKIGDIYGLTRERIRQLLNKILGKKPDRLQERVAEKALVKKTHAETVKFLCRKCNKPVTYGEAGGKGVFCSDKCRRLYRNTERQGVDKCDYCGKVYHPYRVRKFMHLDKGFCCLRHYNLYRSDLRGKGLMGWRTKERDIEIYALRKSGLSYKKIRAIIGPMSTSTLCSIIMRTKRRMG